MTAREIYEGSDAAATKRFYTRLCSAGPLGMLAMNLLRAQKSSARAKVYHGGVRGVASYRSLFYNRKEWALSHLCHLLIRFGCYNDIQWGWKEDPAVTIGMKCSYVLYLDLPNIGQVSFHSPNRGKGPNYLGDWDRTHTSADRIIQFCDNVLCVKENVSLIPF